MRVRFCVFFAVASLLSACGSAPSRQQFSPPPEQISIRKEPANVGEQAKAHTELAGAYYELGNFGVALEEVRAALAADSDYAPALNMQGLIHAELKETAQAQASFERALRAAPRDADVNHNYGWFLCQTGREQQSVNYFIAAIRNPLYPTPAKSYTEAANCLLKVNDEREASGYFDRALRLDPNYVPAMMSFAKLLYKQNAFDQARILVSRFNSLSEVTAESLWLALRIERRRGDNIAEASLTQQLRRRFPASQEYQAFLQGQFE